MEVVDGCTLPCVQKVPQLNVMKGNYSMTNDFYVVELEKTSVALGVLGLCILCMEFMLYFLGLFWQYHGKRFCSPWYWVFLPMFF